MKNRFLLAIITSLMVYLQTNAFRLLNSFTDDITPERSIVRDDTGITVSYTFHGGVILHDELYQGRVRLDIPMFGNNGTLEEPAYPLRNDSFEIPDGYDATLSVISADWCNLEISLSPCRPLLVDRSDEVYSFNNVPPVKDFIGTLPESPVAIYDHQIYRDRKILYVTTMPVKCIDNKVTLVCDKLVYRINFIPSEEKRDPNKILHDVDEEFMACMFTSTIYGDKKAGRYRYSYDKSTPKKASSSTRAKANRYSFKKETKEKQPSSFLIRHKIKPSAINH